MDSLQVGWVSGKRAIIKLEYSLGEPLCILSLINCLELGGEIDVGLLEVIRQLIPFLGNHPGELWKLLLRHGFVHLGHELLEETSICSNGLLWLGAGSGHSTSLVCLCRLLDFF